MEQLAQLMTRLYVALIAPPRRDDRGDVPGWVLVTVMSAGIVMALWGLAEGELKSMLRSALNSVEMSRCRERGAAVVDFVLVLVVLVPLVLGILQVALVMQVRNTLAAAASEGARVAAAADRGPGDGAAATREQIGDAIAGRYAEDVSVRSVSIDGAPGVEVTCGRGCRRWGSAVRRSRSRWQGGRSRSPTGESRQARPPRGGRQRRGRAGLARDPAAGADPVDRAVGVRGAARCVRRLRSRAFGRPRLRPRTHRRRGGAAGARGGAPGARRPGARVGAAAGDGDLYAVPRTTATAAPR